MSMEKILNLGDDQLAAKYGLLLPNGLPGGGDTEEIVLRMDQSIDFPEISAGEYEIGYKGMKIKKTNGTDQTDRTRTIQVRIDQGWKIYNAIVKTARMTFNPHTGLFYPDAQTRFPVIQQWFDGFDNVVKEQVFKYCKIKGYQLEASDPISEEPLRVTMTMIFGPLEENENIG